MCEDTLNKTQEMKMVDLYAVKATSLNVRSLPKVEEDNKIASIPQNHVVSKLSIAGS